MSAVDQDALTASATKVLEGVRERHWRHGDRTVTPLDVKQAIRELRIGAGCTERNLPSIFLALLEDARTRHQSIKLSALMLPLINLSIGTTEDAS